MQEALALRSDLGPTGGRSEPLLSVEDLTVRFRSGRRWITAVRDMSLTVQPGRAVGLVGESGSGKSATAMSVLGLLPRGRGRITGGSVRFRGQELTTAKADELRRVRGTGIGMVFQDPLSSLNPVFTIGDQLTEGLKVRLGMSSQAARARAVELLEMVEIPAAATRLGHYPHQLSGGMRQRVMIAMALSCEPALVIADEPTTALDVTVQAQVLDILDRLRTQLGVALLLISHDLGVVAELADEIAVAYAGHIVEHGPAERVLSTPYHPYTAALLRCRPGLHGAEHARLPSIPGAPPVIDDITTGCPFAPRCDRAEERCLHTVPTPVDVAHGGSARCLLLEGTDDA